MDDKSRFMPILLVDGVVPFPNSKYTDGGYSGGKTRERDRMR